MQCTHVVDGSCFHILKGLRIFYLQVNMHKVLYIRYEHRKLNRMT